MQAAKRAAFAACVFATVMTLETGSTMSDRLFHILVALVLVSSTSGLLAGTKVTINEDKVLLINGKKVFPIGFTMAPPPGAKAPNGRDGLQELHDAGGSFLRSGR